MKQIFPVFLNEEQYNDIKGRLRGGKISVLESTRIRILLLADTARSNYTDIMIVQALGCSRNTVKNIRKKFNNHGLKGAIKRKEQIRPSRKPVADGNASAQIIALACSKAENGAERWTLKQLSKKIVELNIVDSIAPETVRKVLKKMS